MAYSFQYFGEVATDISDAKLWYKQKREGLEIEFPFAVREALESIAKMPTAYTTRYKTVRIAHTKVFPYHIHFILMKRMNSSLSQQ